MQAEPVLALRGRVSELRKARAAVRDAAEGRWVALLVEGEAGIGKTRLVDELVVSARSDGFQVFAGRIEELDRTRPFGGLTDALGCTREATDPRRTAVARLIAPDEPAAVPVTSDPGLRFRVVDALVGLVEEEALEGPVAIMLDDLQWADVSTLQALRALSRRLGDLPVALVACRRPLPCGHELESLLDALVREGGTSLVLGPLEEAAVLDLVADVVGTEPDPGLAARVAAAAGNPLFAIELAKALEQDTAVSVEGSRADVADAGYPRSLRLTIIRRIGFLPENTLKVLRAASLLGSSFSVGDLVTTTERSALDLADILRPALRAGVLEESDRTRLRFRHDLIRDAIYEDLPAVLRQVLHRDVARRLGEADAPALQVAEHLARADRSGDPRAVEWLVRAAREAGSGSPAIAAELLARALEFAGSSHPDCDAIAVDRATALFWAGRIPEAEAAFRDLLDRAHDPAVEGVARTFLTQVLMAQGRVQEAVEEARAVTALPHLPPAERATAQAWAAHCSMLLGDLEEALALAEDAEGTADSVGDDLTASIALCCLAMVRQFQGRFSEAEGLAGRAVARGDRSRQQAGHRFQLSAFHGLTLTDLDRLEEATAALQRGRRISEAIGARWNLPLYQSCLIAGYYLSGDWEEAIAEYETFLDLAEESGTRHGVVCNHAVRALIALHRDELHAAAHALEEAGRELSETGFQYRTAWMMWARALLHEAQGATGQAYSTLAEAWNLCLRMRTASELPILAPDLVRLGLAAGDPHRAQDAASVVEKMASAEPVPWLTATALRCRGLINGQPETLLAAVRACRTSPRVLDRAFALEHAGAALGRAERTAEARALIAEALDLYEALQATRDLARGEAAARVFGFRRGRRGTRRRPTRGWGSLTETEHRVVALVAEGLSNPRIAERLFVSPRTVETHLSHVFTKLGLSSRVELAAHAARRSP